MSAINELRGHQEYVNWMGREILTLADLVPNDPAILFVGYNPRPESVRMGHYYQGARGKQFWYYVVRTGYIAKPGPAQFHDDLMCQASFGFSDLVKRPTDEATGISDDEVVEGRKQLMEKIVLWRPGIICSVFKGALEKLFQCSLTIGWNRVRSTPKPVFVIPFPPGKYVNGDRIEAALRELRTAIHGR